MIDEKNILIADLKKFECFVLGKKIKAVLELCSEEYNKFEIYDGTAIKLIFDDGSMAIIESGSSDSSGILEIKALEIPF